MNSKCKDLPNFKFQWNNDTANEFQNECHNMDMESLIIQLEKISDNVTQCGIDEVCEKLNNKLIGTALKSGVYKKYRNKKVENCKPKKRSQPWYDEECKSKRREYYKIKNALKRSGEKSMSYKKAKEFKAFIKSKEKSYFKELNRKIRSLRSKNSKDYWSLLNKSIEGKNVYSKICLETFMDHFKKLNKSDNYDSIDEIQNKNPIDHNTELNEDFDESEIYTIIHKLKNNKAC
jgi:hypothetical protein